MYRIFMFCTAADDDEEEDASYVDQYCQDAMSLTMIYVFVALSLCGVEIDRVHIVDIFYLPCIFCVRTVCIAVYPPLSEFHQAPN